MINKNIARRNHARILLGSIAALGFAGLSASSAFAVSYTLVPDGLGSPLDWNTAANWSPAGVPGGTVAADIATVSGAFGGVSQTVDISATLTSGLTALTLGDTSGTGTTTIQTSNGSSLVLAGGATVTSAGTVGAVNAISAPISYAGGLNFLAGNNSLTITGKLSPTVASAKTIDNSSLNTVTLGAIDLSVGASASTITIRNGNNSAANTTILAGVIADGSSVASNLILGGRSTGAQGPSTIRIDGTNTYTGSTTLGVQGNSPTLYQINSDQPFGPAGTVSANGLTIGGPSGAVNILEALGSDRTITKTVTTINRSATFQGSNSIAIAATTLNIGNTPLLTNNITATGKTVTLGSAGGSMFLNNNNTDFYRLREFTGAGTTVIDSNIVENSGSAPTAQSKMVIQMSGTGTLLLTGTNTHQGGTRITGTGTVQVGNGGTTGSLDSGNGLTPVVNSTAAGTLVMNRSDAVVTPLTVNGPANLVQKGAGSLTLSNSQFHSGANTVGDGITASKLVVTGSLVPSTATTSNANVAATAVGTLTYRTVTLAGSDTVASLNLKVGQPVYVTGQSASAGSYIDAIISPTQFSVFGPTLLTAGSSALTFGEGSALGTSAAITTVNNLSTLGGTGEISGAVNGLAGSHLAPGVNTVDGDLSGRFNFGVAGTLATGSLTLTGATLDFDLAATAGGTSDLISVGSGALSFNSLSFTFDALTAGVLEMGTPYNLVSGTGVFTGDASLIATDFSASLQGLYTPVYSVNNLAGTNYLQVTFAPIPEPASAGLVLGLVTLGGGLVRRRRKPQA